jgi:hypothetical protein
MIKLSIILNDFRLSKWKDAVLNMVGHYGDAGRELVTGVYFSNYLYPSDEEVCVALQRCSGPIPGQTT